VRLEDKAISARRRGLATQYHDDKDCTLMVTDYRSMIVVHAVEPVSVQLALTLAARRWEVVRAEGSPRFLELCARIAARQNIQLVGVDNTPLLPPARPRRAVPEPGPRAVSPEAAPAPAPIARPVPAKYPAVRPRQEEVPDRKLEASEEEASLEQLLWWQQRNGRGR